MRTSWVATRKGQANVSQMHFARKGIITEEMTFVANKEKLPEFPAVVVLVMPVGVCSATIVAPPTFTLPLIPEVVSTSA